MRGVTCPWHKPTPISADRELYSTDVNLSTNTTTRRAKRQNKQKTDGACGQLGPMS